MTSATCSKCGHDEFYYYGINYVCKKCDNIVAHMIKGKLKWISCEKFTPQEVDELDVEQAMLYAGSSPQGCGKEAGITYSKLCDDYDVAFCGEYVIKKQTGEKVLLLCPKCKPPQNHKPEIAERITQGHRDPWKTSSEDMTSKEPKVSTQEGSTPSSGTQNLAGEELSK